MRGTSKGRAVLLVLLVGLLALFVASCRPKIDDPFSGSASYKKLKEQNKLPQGIGSDFESKGGASPSSATPGNQSSSVADFGGIQFASRDREEVWQVLQEESEAELGQIQGENGAQGETSEQQKRKEEIKQRFEKYRDVNFRNIIREKYDQLKTKLTDVNRDIPYTNVGRTDPLSFTDPRIPPELRPPRQGETDISRIQNYFMQLAATQLIEQTQIQVLGVLAVGFRREVSARIDGRRVTLSECGPFIGGGCTTVTPRGVMVAAIKVSQDEVRFLLQVGSLSKERVFIPR